MLTGVCRSFGQLEYLLQLNASHRWCFFFFESGYTPSRAIFQKVASDVCCVEDGMHSTIKSINLLQCGFMTSTKRQFNPIFSFSTNLNPGAEFFLPIKKNESSGFENTTVDQFWPPLSLESLYSPAGWGDFCSAQRLSPKNCWVAGVAFHEFCDHRRH